MDYVSRLMCWLLVLPFAWSGIAYSIDLDGDGVSDVWQAQGTDEPIPNRIAKSPDSDGDGLTNWEELQLGFDPKNPASVRSESDGGDAEQFKRLMAGTGNGDALSEESAARFLLQSTLGPTDAEIERVQKLGYEKWIDQQLKRDSTKTEPYIEYLISRCEEDLPKSGNLFAYQKIKSAGRNVGKLNSGTAWMRAVLGGDDHLRQRVTWALSQIFVATSNGINILTEGTCHYYDSLSENAFGDYEDLLFDVSLHPLMGKYLSHLGNRKADPAINRYPDENYAREIMQLFSIGLWKLNPDGSMKLDHEGEPIATYSNEDIQTLARVFTGLWIANQPYGSNNWDEYDVPMVFHEKHHDLDEKIALGGRLNIPAGMDPVEGVRQTVGALANHPTTAPFISIRLINHLVTSNPSPEYVGRVVAVWNETSGNLGAVVKAILLDEEARGTRFLTDPHFGRLKDPMLRTTTILRAFRGGEMLGKGPTDYPGLQWWSPSPLEDTQQAPMRSPSVFNFYEAVYQRPGAIAEKNLRSPEFQIMNDVTAATVPNYLWEGISEGFHHRPSQRPEKPLTCDFSEEENLSIDALLDRCSLLLTAGTMRATTRKQLAAFLESQENATERVQMAVFGSAVCPEGAILR